MKKQISYLLIDDDEDDMEFFKHALKNVDPGILLHYSSSGCDAIKNLKDGNYKPDYIFLDLNMMPINGIESLVKIKNIAQCVDIPVIIYSTTINENIKYKTLNLGASGHFEKPSSRQGLEEYLKKIIQINYKAAKYQDNC